MARGTSRSLEIRERGMVLRHRGYFRMPILDLRLKKVTHHGAHGGHGAFSPLSVVSVNSVVSHSDGVLELRAHDRGLEGELTVDDPLGLAQDAAVALPDLLEHDVHPLAGRDLHAELAVLDAAEPDEPL